MAAEWGAGPGFDFAIGFGPEQRPGAFVFDEEDGERSGDGDAEPVVAGGEVAGEVDCEGGFAGAAVAVDHDVASGGDEGVATVA